MFVCKKNHADEVIGVPLVKHRILNKYYLRRDKIRLKKSKSINLCVFNNTKATGHAWKPQRKMTRRLSHLRTLFIKKNYYSIFPKH